MPDFVVKRRVVCGEITCAPRPGGNLCPQIGVRRFGTEFVCMLFGDLLYDETEDHWIKRSPKCLAAEREVVMGRFAVNDSAGTVTDTSTGLVWQRNAPPERMTWAEAQAYASSLAKVSGGWRLPTVEELFCLADRSRHNPSIDSAAFPDCPGDWFWSATPWVGGGSAWGVNFYDGYSGYSDTSSTSRVRCVR